MRHVRHIGAFFSQKAFGWARALYVAILLIWCILTIWRVASGSLLETPDTSTTLIKIDLLGAVAFLAAWSLLLITLTTKVVNKGRDIEFVAVDSTRKLDDIKADMMRHEEGHPDIESEVDRMQAKVSGIAEGMIQLKSENERVTKENEQLRRQLEGRATDD